MDGHDFSALRVPAHVAAAVADLRATHGSEHEVRGKLSGGLQGGAWLLATSTDERRVLKVTEDASLLSRREETANLVRRLVHRGYPTPPWLLTGLTNTGIGYVLAPYVEGKTPTWSTLDLPGLLDAIELQADAADPSPSTWSDYIKTVLEADSNAITTLRRGGPDTAAVADRALDLAGRIGPVSLPRSDAVHGDLCLANLLERPGYPSTIVDIDACGAGTRALDHAWLYRDAATATVPADSLELIRMAGEAAAGADAFRYLVIAACCELLAFQVRRATPTLDTHALHRCMTTLG